MRGQGDLSCLRRIALLVTFNSCLTCIICLYVQMYNSLFYYFSSATPATSPVCDSAPVVPNTEEPDSQLQSSSSSIDAPPISDFTLEIYDSEFQSPLSPNTNVSPDSTLKTHDTNQHNSISQYPPASTSDDFISEIIPNKNMINTDTYSLSEQGTVEPGICTR